MGSDFNSTFTARYSAFSPYRLSRREMGFGTPIGAGDAMARSLYCGMKPIASWDCEQTNALPTGGVFNLEFSPEGSLLVAACEKKSIQIFDPLTHQRIHSVNGAHSDCVNCVKFLDGRMFATCSDDTTIALWDVRNLRKKIRTLLGHSNWVKNIEFSVKDKLLVTSGLDGSIYTWDINSYTECNLIYQRVFHASGLMRCRLSPDARQMIMCTTGGLLVIIHDLNLQTLAQDLQGFKPNLYRLMQMSQQLIPMAALYDHLFEASRKENRIEFVSDFPEGNDAEVVSALQIHPQGWSALSRNISHDDRSEWSCIHDIQPMASPCSKGVRDSASARLSPARRLARRLARRRNRPYATPAASASAEAPSSSSRSQDREGDREESEPEASPRPEPSTSGRLGVREIPIHTLLLYRGQVGRNFNMQRIMGINTGIAPPAPAPPPAAAHPPRAPEHAPPDQRATSPIPSTSGAGAGVTACAECTEGHGYIRSNRRRLLYYIEETNEGKGFIKELCYSADGRLVCSPFGRGMRLLALSDACSELSQCVGAATAAPAPRRMKDVGQSLGIHQDLVVSSKFSPRHHLLVTGCLEGKIVWYEPYSGEALY